MVDACHFTLLSKLAECITQRVSSSEIYECQLYYSKLVTEKLFVREFRALDQILKALSKFPPKLDEECVQERATRKWYTIPWLMEGGMLTQ